MASHLRPTTLKPPTHATKSPPRNTPASPIPLSKRPTYAPQAQGRGFGLTTTTTDKKKITEDSNNNKGGEDEDDEIPEVVFNRMLGRILLIVGAPMASGVGMIYVMSTLQERGVWESPGWLPFLTMTLSFGTSALGVAYGSLSTSWDLENEGSWLGWDEARKNWPKLWAEEEEEKGEM